MSSSFVRSLGSRTAALLPGAVAITYAEIQCTPVCQRAYCQSRIRASCRRLGCSTWGTPCPVSAALQPSCGSGTERIDACLQFHESYRVVCLQQGRPLDGGLSETAAAVDLGICARSTMLDEIVAASLVQARPPLMRGVEAALPGAPTMRERQFQFGAAGRRNYTSGWICIAILCGPGCWRLPEALSEESCQRWTCPLQGAPRNPGWRTEGWAGGVATVCSILLCRERGATVCGACEVRGGWSRFPPPVWLPLPGRDALAGRPARAQGGSPGRIPCPTFPAAPDVRMPCRCTAWFAVWCDGVVMGVRSSNGGVAGSMAAWHRTRRGVGRGNAAAMR